MLSFITPRGYRSADRRVDLQYTHSVEHRHGVTSHGYPAKVDVTIDCRTVQGIRVS